MAKEKHPYLDHFHNNPKPWKYLIIGTFPPNQEIRKSKIPMDYFYSNKGTLWSILDKIYKELNFNNKNGCQIIETIKNWQDKYSIGITDTLQSVTRKESDSWADSDFLLEWEDYNHNLKTYILEHRDFIQKIFFTSSKGRNSAFENFKKIMGKEINILNQSQLITHLPSPSGSANIACFNANNALTLGLHPDFYEFIRVERPNKINDFEQRWEQKKKKKELNDIRLIVNKAPQGLVTDFKIWSYKKEFPKPF